MNTYKEMYQALSKLCKNEGLRLIEAELEDKGMIVWFHKEYIIVNTVCRDKELHRHILKFFKLL